MGSLLTVEKTRFFDIEGRKSRDSFYHSRPCKEFY